MDKDYLGRDAGDIANEYLNMDIGAEVSPRGRILPESEEVNPGGESILPEKTVEPADAISSSESSSKKKETTSTGDFIKSLVVDIVIAVILAAIVLTFIRPTVVRQSSMEDTLHSGDYMIMYRKAYSSDGPERGDIIIFQSSLVDEDTGNEKLLIKRVIGLPGDEIGISNGMVYINGEAYEEDYLKDGYTPAFEIPEEGGTYTVPDNSYFCMGDNRAGSVDSRRTEVGCVDADQIEGKVILRLFPFSKIQRF